MRQPAEDLHWFGFRQTHPRPPGQVIACGPYRSWEEAKREREKAKASDAEVSVPFVAASKEEATARAKQLLS